MCLIASDRRLPLGIYQGHWRPLHCLLTTTTVHGRGRAYRSAAEASSPSCLCTPVFPLRLSYLLHRPQQFVPIRSLSFQIRRVKTARLEWTQPAFAQSLNPLYGLLLHCLLHGPLNPLSLAIRPPRYPCPPTSFTRARLLLLTDHSLGFCLEEEKLLNYFSSTQPPLLALS